MFEDQWTARQTLQTLHQILVLQNAGNTLNEALSNVRVSSAVSCTSVCECPSFVFMKIIDIIAPHRATIPMMKTNHMHKSVGAGHVSQAITGPLLDHQTE